MNWQCLCGNFVKDKRFCPKCKLVRFDIKRDIVLCYSGLNLGSLRSGLPFLFPANFLANHVIVVGQTGTGKSRLAMSLVVQTENIQTKLLIIDVEGEWKNVIPYMKNKTEYFSVDSTLKINPFDLGDPALVRELMRETVFKGIEKEYIDLSAQMNFVLQETIAESSNIEELIRNIKSYNKQKLTALDKTKTALLVRLDPFLRNPLKEIFNCKKSNPDLNQLDDHNIIIDLHALDALVAYNSELRLIYNTITTYFLRKMLNRGTCDCVSNLFVADEAQLLVPKILRKLIVTESWPATEFVTRLRKRGCGVMFITQSPSNIEKDILRNVGTKFVFRIQDPEDLRLISDSFGFLDITEHEYLANVLVKMTTKECIVHTLGHDPFFIVTANFEPAQYNVSQVPVQETAPEPHKTEQIEYTEDEQTFIQDIGEKPFISVRERRHTLGWDERRYTRVVNKLLENSVIEKVRIKLGRGGQTVLYQTQGTVPSIKHEYYVHWIVKQLEARGLFCKTGKVGPDIQIQSLNAAIDVELGKSDIYGNINKTAKEFDKVIVCSDDKKLVEALSRENQPENVRCALVQDVPALFASVRTDAGRLNR